MSLGDLLHEGGLLFVLGKDILETIRNLAKTEGTAAVKNRMAKSSEEARAEVVALFTKDAKLRKKGRGAKPAARDEFIRRQNLRQHLSPRTYGLDPKEPYKPLDEETMMGVLIMLYKGLQEKNEQTLLVDVFHWMFAELGDEDFDTVVEALDNDAALQMFLNVLRLGREAFVAITTRIASYPLTGRIREFLAPENLARIAREGLDAAKELDWQAAERIETARRNYPWWMVRHNRPKKNPILHFFGF